jgi:putative inorganic carbon (hco3(-)) transporter
LDKNNSVIVMRKVIFSNLSRKLILRRWQTGQHLNETVFIKKFDALGKWFPVSVSLFASILIGLLGLKIGVIISIMVWAVPIILLTIFDGSFGVLLILVVSFVINWIGRRMPDLPTGLIIDILTALALFGIFIKQVRLKDWSFAKNEVTTYVLLWMAYCFFQIANPWAESRLAWVYTIRGMAGIMVIYFIVLSAANKTSFINKVLFIWIVLAFFGAIYGLIQEFSGLSSFDLAWVKADEFRFKLFYNWGKFRVFGYFTDPTVFGVLMAYTGLFCLSLCFSPIAIFYRIALLIMAFTMLMAMIFSGTRTAFACVPVGVAFFALLTFQRHILIATGVMLVLGAGIIFGPVNSLGPISTNSLNRIRSAFNPTDDPSYNVRARNQAYIQPYIQRHPIGGGLGSTGVWGARFSPNSELAKFPPDSGFVRVAVEMGWFGLLLYCALFFVLLKAGITNYFHTKNPLLRSYLASITTVLFTLTVANFPQQSVNIYPTVLIFYICIALVVKIKEIDSTLHHV